jgi:formamidopyrimidine-DNA glycosylase
MPELPEVEIYGRYFARYALRQPIARVEVRDERVLGNMRKEKLGRALRGHAFTRVARHGKHLFADFGAGWLHFHFGMSGDLGYYGNGAAEPRFARVIFDFTNGAHLAFEDMRLFGVVDLTPSPAAYVEEHRLGADPLEPNFGLADFRRLIERRRGAVKSLLMSQNILAGVGNLYADETLFQSAINPRRPVDRVRPDEAKVLYTSMRRILREAIVRRASGRELPRKYLFLHREEGERCPICAGTIRRTVVFGRTTYFCGNHQR